MPSDLPRVFPDTNVCYPTSLLDLVLRCDEHDLHRVMWTDDLLDELQRVWVRQGVRSTASARRITEQIRAAFHKQQVRRRDYEHLIEEMPGRDADDHLHAAAAVSIAPSILLTANIRDFPREPLAVRGVVIRHPDAYFTGLLKEATDQLLEVIDEMARARRNPPMAAGDVLAAIERAGLPKFARLAAHA